MIKTFTPRLAEIGKIKIGGKGEERKSKNGKKFRLPVKYDHFVITKNEKDQYGNFVINEKVMDSLGEKPKEIKIQLLYDSIELNFLSSFSFYHGRKCVCRGNGETAIRIEKGEKKEIKCTSGECVYLIDGRCKPSGILSAVLSDSNQIGGVYKFRTHSWNSVYNIQSSLAYLKSETGGKLAGIPLKLQIIKKATEEHGNVVTVNIVFDGNKDALVKATIAENKRREQFKIDINKIENIAVKNGITEDNDDPEDVEDEFYSDAPITADDKAMTISADAFVTSDEKIIEEKKDDVIQESQEDKSISELL